MVRTPHPPSTIGHHQNQEFSFLNKNGAEPPTSLPRRGRQGQHRGWASQRGGVRKLRTGFPCARPPPSPPLPLLAQVHQLGHVIAQLDLHHFTRRVRVPVPSAGRRQKKAIRKETPGRRDTLVSKGGRAITLLISVLAETSSLCLLPKGKFLKLNTNRPFLIA